MSLQLIPFIMLNGNANEAIQFYEDSLGAKVLFKQMAGDSVAHSVLKIGETEIFLSDLIPDQTHQIGNQVNICITLTNADKAKQLYETLLQDGQINIPLKETDFSPAYAMVTDKFGVVFQIFTKIQR